MKFSKFEIVILVLFSVFILGGVYETFFKISPSRNVQHHPQKRHKVLEEIQAIPHVKNLMDLNPAFAEFVKEKSPYLNDHTVNFMKGQPGFYQYLSKHPETVDEIMGSPQPAQQFGKAFLEYVGYLEELIDGKSCPPGDIDQEK